MGRAGFEYRPHHGLGRGCVDHCRAHVLVSHRFLNGADVVAAANRREQLVAFLPECLSGRRTTRVTTRFPRNHEPHGNDSLVRCENLDMRAINRQGPRRRLREKAANARTSVQIKLSPELVGLLARSSKPARRHHTSRLREWLRHRGENAWPPTFGAPSMMFMLKGHFRLWAPSRKHGSGDFLAPAGRRRPPGDAIEFLAGNIERPASRRTSCALSRCTRCRAPRMDTRPRWRKRRDVGPRPVAAPDYSARRQGRRTGYSSDPTGKDGYR